MKDITKQTDISYRVGLNEYYFGRLLAHVTTQDHAIQRMKETDDLKASHYSEILIFEGYHAIQRRFRPARGRDMECKSYVYENYESLEALGDAMVEDSGRWPDYWSLAFRIAEDNSKSD